MWLQTKQTEFNSSQNRQTAAHQSSFWYRYCAQVDTTVLSRKNKNTKSRPSSQCIHTPGVMTTSTDEETGQPQSIVGHAVTEISASFWAVDHTSKRLGFTSECMTALLLGFHFKQSPPPLATGLPICTMSSVIFHEWLQSTPKPSFYKSSVVTSPPQQISVLPEREKQRGISSLWPLKQR